MRIYNIAFGGTLLEKDYFFQGFTSPDTVATAKNFHPDVCTLDNGKERFELLK